MSADAAHFNINNNIIHIMFSLFVYVYPRQLTPWNGTNEMIYFIIYNQLILHNIIITAWYACMYIKQLNQHQHLSIIIIKKKINIQYGNNNMAKQKKHNYQSILLLTIILTQQ